MMVVVMTTTTTTMMMMMEMMMVVVVVLVVVTTTTVVVVVVVTTMTVVVTVKMIKQWACCVQTGSEPLPDCTKQKKKKVERQLLITAELSHTPTTAATKTSISTNKAIYIRFLSFFLFSVSEI